MANDFLLDMQSKSGAFIWNIDEDGEYDIDFLLTGNSSIVKSFECSIFLADEMGNSLIKTNGMKFIKVQKNVFKPQKQF